MNSRVIIVTCFVAFLFEDFATSMPVQQGSMPEQVRVRHLQRGTRIPKLVLAKQEVGSRHTNTGTNMNLININAITHNKRSEPRKPEYIKQKVLKPVAQAFRAQMCMFSIDIPPQENVSPSTTTSEPYSEPLGSRMNTIFSSHNWGNSK